MATKKSNKAIKSNRKKAVITIGLKKELITTWERCAKSADEYQLSTLRFNAKVESAQLPNDFMESGTPSFPLFHRS